MNYNPQNTRLLSNTLVLGILFLILSAVSFYDHEKLHIIKTDYSLNLFIILLCLGIFFISIVLINYCTNKNKTTKIRRNNSIDYLLVDS
jgi:hypothetical protein